ncbi:hypothetical protein B0H13DRAFT_1889443 [Mycena leptocephala]|nr:hypothetical protein B0H13DRAFT_1889443 [Mycena leptocephala]
MYRITDHLRRVEFAVLKRLPMTNLRKIKLEILKAFPITIPIYDLIPAKCVQCGVLCHDLPSIRMVTAMSSSTPKIISIHVMHKSLSPLQTEFETKLEALLDEALQLPLVQTNLLKVEIIFQENTFDEHVKAFGFAPREHVVFVKVHCELLGDPEVRRLVEKGKEFGPPSGSYFFAADVVARFDNPAPRDGAVHLISPYNVPPHVSSRKFEHDQKYEEFIANFLAVPKIKKNVVRLEMWKHNNMLDDHIRALGYAEAEPVFFHHAIIENWDNTLEIMEDPEAQQCVMNAGNSGRDFNLKTDCYCFHGRVVTKVDKFT